MSRPAYYIMLILVASAVVAGIYFQRGWFGADDVCLWPFTQ